jgi:hypothetical protein
MSKSNALLLSFTLVLTGLSTTSLSHSLQAAYSQTDYEEYLIVETNTEQNLAQKNVGSGESININCAKNLISSAANTVCSDTQKGQENTSVIFNFILTTRPERRPASHKDDLVRYRSQF